MTEAIERLCALAIFCGVLLSVMPEGGVKRLAGIGCTAALLLTVLGAVRSVRTEDFTFELSRYRELSEELTASGEQARDKLDRSVIESEFETYISDEAALLSLPEPEASVTARWELPGLWLPYEVRLSGAYDAAARRRLSERIVAELGIPEERIVWTDES